MNGIDTINVVDIWSTYTDRNDKLELAIDDEQNLSVLDSRQKIEVVKINSKLVGSPLRNLVESLGFTKTRKG